MRISPEHWPRLCFGTTPMEESAQVSPFSVLDWRLRALLWALKAFASNRAMTLSEKRQAFEQNVRRGTPWIVGATLQVDSVLNLAVPLLGRTLNARLYSPSARTRSSVVFFHGGGWTVGTLDSHDNFCRRLALSSGAGVLAVDYRLAPEHPFPAAFEDALDSTRWWLASCERYGIDSATFGLCGDSAGGNLAAAVAARLRADGEPRLRAEALIYPVLDCRAQSRSYQRFGRGFFLERSAMREYIENYLPREEDRCDLRASPLMGAAVAEVKTVNRTLMLLAACDVLFDEGNNYAEVQRARGLPVTLSVYPRVVHGFVTMCGLLPQARRAIDELGAFFKAELSHAS
jgi:acetyl esterase